jgi:hypothetical protein
MSDPGVSELSGSSSYVISVKWGLEGLVMPAVGEVGVSGKLNRLSLILNYNYLERERQNYIHNKFI